MRDIDKAQVRREIEERLASGGDGFSPTMRREYESRCEKISPNVYRLKRNIGGSMGSRLAEVVMPDFFHKLAVTYAPAAEEAIAWLKGITPVWPDLIVSFAAEKEDTSGVTLEYLHAVEIDVAQTFEDVSRFDNFVTVITHEFGHVAQHCTGRLVHDKWDGKRYRQAEREPADYDSYLAQPWEVDARAFSDKHRDALAAHLRKAGLVPPDMPTIRDATLEALNGRL